MNFHGNALFREVYKDDFATLYMPVDITAYHKSREVAMQAQERYANSGISKEILTVMCSKAIEMCNKQTSLDTLRTDMAILWNNILARTANPVDELCAIRMGAIACFLEGEDPDSVEMAWTEQKMRLAMEHPNIYAFFLNMGIAFTPEYSNLLRGLKVEDYLSSRAEMLQGLTIQPIHSRE